MSLQLRIGIAAQMLGVCTKTLRRWEKAGTINCFRTVGGHRRFSVWEIRRLQEGTARASPSESAAQERTAIYARVSSHEQKKKGDLERQVQVAREFCHQESTSDVPAVFTDVGSGLNTTRRGFQKLCRAIEAGEVERVLVTYPDRLTRFGFRYLETYFKSHGVSITCLQQAQHQSLQAELVEDLIAIVTSFSGRVHGLRSHKNKKARKKKKITLNEHPTAQSPLIGPNAESQ